MMYTHAAAGIAGAILAGVLAWHVQAWRYDAQIAGIKTAHAQAATLASEEAARNFRTITTQYEGALNDARKREVLLRRDADRARAESDSLRTQLSHAARLIADAPPAAVAEYATTVGELLAVCSRERTFYAEKADGHATDVQTHRESWPVTGAADARHQD